MSPTSNAARHTLRKEEEVHSGSSTDPAGADADRAVILNVFNAHPDVVSTEGPDRGIRQGYDRPCCDRAGRGN
jgi:hypothetical protein